MVYFKLKPCYFSLRWEICWSPVILTSSYLFPLIVPTHIVYGLACVTSWTWQKEWCVPKVRSEKSRATSTWFTWMSCPRGSQPPYRKDTRPALQKSTHPDKPRSPVNNHPRGASHVSAPPWKQFLRCQSSLWTTAPSWNTPQPEHLTKRLPNCSQKL